MRGNTILELNCKNKFDSPWMSCYINRIIYILLTNLLIFCFSRTFTWNRFILRISRWHPLNLAHYLCDHKAYLIDMKKTFICLERDKIENDLFFSFQIIHSSSHEKRIATQWHTFYFWWNIKWAVSVFPCTPVTVCNFGQCAVLILL